MEDQEFLYPLPKELSILLTTLVDLSRKGEVLNVSWTAYGSPKSYQHNVYTMSSGGHSTDVELPIGNHVLALVALGFAYQLAEQEICLTKQAFSWVEYQRMSRFRKFLRRIWAKNRDVVLAVTTTLTITLTILQIIELFS